MQLNKYMNELSLRRSTEKNGEINITTLLYLEERHLPRIQEIVRLLEVFVSDVAKSYPNDDIDESEMLITRAETMLEKVDELAKDGLGDLFIESLDPDLELD